MNPAFRDYVFGRAFTLHLRETQCNALADLCRDGAQGYIFDQRQAGALLTRGLIEPVIESQPDKNGRYFRYRPTRAGLLVYDLLVEAGEAEELGRKRRAVVEDEDRAHREDWERRFGRIEVKLRQPEPGVPA